MAKKGKGGKGKGFFGSVGSFLGSIPAVGKVKNAAKSVKKKIKNTKKKLKKAIKKAKKKLKKKLKKKIGKVFTKARKLKNNLSKSKLVKKIKRGAKKVVLATKKVASKAKSTAKAATKAVTQTAKKVATAVKSIDVKQAISTAVDFIPIVGNVKAAYEVVIGKDPFTGKKLAPWERAVSAAAIVGGPAVKGAKHAAKIGGSAFSGIAMAGKKGVPTKAPAAPPKATKPPAKPTETKKPSKSTPPVAAKPKATPAPTKATKPPAKATGTKAQSKSQPVAAKPKATPAPVKSTKPPAKSIETKNQNQSKNSNSINQTNTTTKNNNKPLTTIKQGTCDSKKFTGAGMKDYDKAAEAEYELIRNVKMKDIENVANNTGISVEEIRTMKKHLFFGKHQIPQPGGKEFKLERFGADDEIAFAWKTAQKRELSSEQKGWFKQLAEHELTERKLMAEGQKYRTLESWNQKKGTYDGFPPGAHENAPTQPNTAFPGYEEYFFNNMFK